MKKVFNLQKYIRTAFYDDARGYWNGQTRAWMNCYKQKSDRNVSPQEAWNNCLDEYQKTADKGKWMLSYSSDKEDAKKPYLDAKTPAVKKMLK